MGPVDQQNQKIDQITQKINQITSAEMTQILSYISWTLSNILTNGNLVNWDTFVVWKKTKEKLQNLSDMIWSQATTTWTPSATWTWGTTWTAFSADWNGLFQYLENDRNSLDAAIQTNNGIWTWWTWWRTWLNELITKIHNDEQARDRIMRTHTQLTQIQTNVTGIKNIVDHIKTGSLTTQTWSFTPTPAQYTWFTNINLDNEFFSITPTTYNYTLCNENGQALTQNTAWVYEITIDWNKYTLHGVAINTGTNQLEFTGVTLNPPQNSSPLSLKLSIKANVDVTIAGENIHVVHNKPLELKFENPAVNALDHTAMETQYASLNLNELIVNTTTTPTNHKEYEHHVDKWEEECLEEVLGKWELKPEFDRIKSDATLKEILMKRMKECLFDSTSGLFSNWHIFADNTVIQDTFKAYVTDETIIDKEKRKNITVYKDFLTANYKSLFKNSCKKFITWELSKDIIHDELNKVFSKFLQDESDGKFDNAQFHLESLRLLDDHRTNTTNNWRKNPYSFWLGVFNHLRYNYSNLICGASKEIKGQTFNYTTDGQNKSMTYNLNLDCKHANHFELNITIQGKKDPLNFVADTPDKLMSAILKTAFTKDREPLNCKLRVRMVLSALKALMVMCPGTEESKDYHILERNVNLDLDPTWTHDYYERLRVEKSDSWKLRIVATHLEDAWTWSPKYVAKTKTLFDEDTFMQLNDISLLEEWLWRVAWEITRQLNNKAKRHKKSIDTWITRRKSEMSKNYQPVTFFRNIFNLRKDTDFSFQTTTQSWIEIQFNAKKNRWTLGNWDYSITKKDIWKILQDKHFNGKQFEIISAINKAELKNMYDKDPSLSGRYFIVNDASTTWIARKYIIHGNELYTLDALVYEDKDSLKEGKAHEISLSALPGWLQVCTAQEKENFFTNPVLVWRMIKCMKGKLKFRTKKNNQKGKVIPLYSWESFRQAA